MNKKSYFDVAYNDYLFFMNVTTSRLDYPNYNAILIGAQQIVEKLYKYIIDEFCNEYDNTDVLRSHKLITLAATVKEQYHLEILQKADLRFLTDFYFDGRYPGNDFVIATREDAETAIELVKQMMEAVEKIRL